jgi:hypothetical protein
MPLDHYVSQVHLKKFYSPALGNRVYAIRKADLKAFTPDSQSVCRVMDGSTNSYLRMDRMIEDFLKMIEPNYNRALSKLTTGEIDSDSIFTIAGFVAYILTCSPAGMRIQSIPLKQMIEHKTAMMDAKGDFSPPPAMLGGKGLTELLQDGDVEVVIDQKYPQAVGIASIMKLINIFGNCQWEILHNCSIDSPFFTSDFPVAIEETSDPRVLNRIVPLTPNLAVRIKPDISIDRDQVDPSFPKFSWVRRHILHSDVAKINTLLVRCAEDTVFYRDNHHWIEPFIRKNRYYRIEVCNEKLITGAGTILFSTQKVVAAVPLPGQAGASTTA